jgi:proteic killer suppression protein
MIENFRCKETRQLWETGKFRRFNSITMVALRKLAMLDAAENLEDLRGDRKGLHSIRVNDQWRVCFRWEDGRVLEVEIVDFQ